MSLIEGFEANHNFSGLIGATEIDETTPVGIYHIESQRKIRVIKISGETVEEFPIEQLQKVRTKYGFDEKTDYGTQLLTQ